jgi:hypothetical protein
LSPTLHLKFEGVEVKFHSGAYKTSYDLVVLAYKTTTFFLEHFVPPPQTYELQLAKMFGKDEEPTKEEVISQRRPSNVDALQNVHRKSVSNKGLTGASALTVRQSIVPITLVTILFFLWGFAVSNCYYYYYYYYSSTQTP